MHVNSYLNLLFFYVSIKIIQIKPYYIFCSFFALTSLNIDVLPLINKNALKKILIKRHTIFKKFLYFKFIKVFEKIT